MDTIEDLAAVAHDAWVEQKRTNGFHPAAECPYRKRVKVKFAACEKCRTDMVIYNQLTERAKDYDRAIVHAILAVLRGDLR